MAFEGCLARKRPEMKLDVDRDGVEGVARRQPRLGLGLCLDHGSGTTDGKTQKISNLPREKMLANLSVQIAVI